MILKITLCFLLAAYVFQPFLYCYEWGNPNVLKCGKTPFVEMPNLSSLSVADLEREGFIREEIIAMTNVSRSYHVCSFLPPSLIEEVMMPRSLCSAFEYATQFNLLIIFVVISLLVPEPRLSPM